MSVSGEVYVEVNAEAVNSGISMLDASGGASGGESGSSWWLLWSYTVLADETVIGGYTGQNWLWGASNNQLSIAWEGSTYAEQYGPGEDGFKKYLAAVRPNNLDAFLAGWHTESKNAFVNEIVMEQTSGCVQVG